MFLSKQYLGFAKILIASFQKSHVNDSTAESDLVVVTEILQTFVAECTNLYSVGFISYNVHSLLHLVDDYKMYGWIELNWIELNWIYWQTANEGRPRPEELIGNAKTQKKKWHTYTQMKQ